MDIMKEHGEGNVDVKALYQRKICCAVYLFPYNNSIFIQFFALLSNADSVKLSYIDQFLKLNERNEDGEKLTDKEIIHELNTMIAAGSETNALTISFTLVMLAMNPEIQVSRQ